MKGKESDMGTLSILSLDPNRNEVQLWNRSKPGLEEWNLHIEIIPSGLHRTVIEATCNGPLGDIAIDDVVIAECASLGNTIYPTIM